MSSENFAIGIAPTPESFETATPEPAPNVDQSPGPETVPAVLTFPAPPEPTPVPSPASGRVRVGDYIHDPARPAWGSWFEYRQWRMSKCPRRPGNTDALRLEEIDQATAEAIGECAELGQLWLQQLTDVFDDAECRARLIDEAGDCLFTLTWAADAWGLNPFVTHASPIEMLDPEMAAANSEFINSLRNPGDEATAWMALHRLANPFLNLLMNAGLLANAYKKERFRGRRQVIKVQAERVVAAMECVAVILAMAGSSVEEALKVNIAKLDAWFPDGYQADRDSKRTGRKD